MRRHYVGFHQAPQNLDSFSGQLIAEQASTATIQIKRSGEFKPTAALFWALLLGIEPFANKAAWSRLNHF